MSKKRPLDKLRDSALQMTIGTSDDRSRITGTITVGGTLYVVKENGIYEIKLADQIDPERTNANVQNTNQQVLNYGSESEWIGRTLMTADTMLNKTFLSKRIDVDRALSLVFQAIKELASMQDITVKFLRDEAEAAATLEQVETDRRSLSMPAKSDVETICKSFIQKADHALQRLFEVVKVFYGDKVGKQRFKSFAAHLLDEHGSEDHFTEFLNDALPFVQFVRRSRNCVEHTLQGRQQVLVTDFVINADGKINPPTIEVIHPKFNQPPILISNFMNVMNEQCVGVFELMLVLMCEKYA